MLGAIAKGLITDEEAASLLNPLRTDISRLDAEIKSAESFTNVIELHPLAVKLFRENLENLAEILNSGDDPSGPAVDIFRSLIEAIVVPPRAAGAEHKVQIKARTDVLTSADMSVIEMVAGEGLEPPTPGL